MLAPRRKRAPRASKESPPPEAACLCLRHARAISITLVAAACCCLLASAAPLRAAHAALASIGGSKSATPALAGAPAAAASRSASASAAASSTASASAAPSATLSAAPSPPPRRGLFLVIGEHGRTGGQGTRERGAPASYFEQRLASLSHVDLAWHLARRHGVVSDISVLSYSSPFAADLCDWYARGPGTLLSCEFLPEPIGLEALTRLAGERTVLNVSLGASFAGHGFALMLRVDLILKRLFKHALDPFTNRITFSHNAQVDLAVNSGGRAFDGGPLAVAVDGITVLLPRELWAAYFDARSNYHDTWVTLEKRGVPRTRLGFMIPTLHDADSAADWIPMYRIAGRAESCVWQSPGWVFDQQRYDETGNASEAYRLDERWASRASFWGLLGVDDTCPPERPRVEAERGAEGAAAELGAEAAPA